MNNKLAPIFGKLTKHRQPPGRKAPRVLTEAEKRALEVRRAFLTSGVPEELKRQKTSVVVPVTDAYLSVIWPTDSHTQQRPAKETDAEQYCDPWTLQSCDFCYRDLDTGIVVPPAPIALGSFTSVPEKAACYNLQV